MTAPLILPGGSLTIQISEQDTSDPQRLYTALSAWEQIFSTWRRQVGQVVNGLQALSNTTTTRPTAAQLLALPNSGVGYSVLDTTLNKPIWWQGAHWIDATGATV